ncbi:MAG: heparinase II/III family protein [Lentisphaerae bacterium]|nr:heparinase II/III family protein [Lentisphaerota bacterium]
MSERISRGLMAGLSVEGIRDKIQWEPYRALWQRLQWRWQEALKVERESGQWVTWGSLGWHSATPMVVEAGLVWRLSGNPDALRHVADCIGRLSGILQSPEAWKKQFPFDGPPVLSFGEVALAADLCRKGLGGESLRQLKETMLRHVIGCTCFPDSLTGYAAGSNTPFCRNVNAGIAALVWGEACGFDGWESVVDQAVAVVRQFLRHGCDEQGYGYEGTGYSHSTFHFLYLFAQLLAQNDRQNLFELEPVLRRIPYASLQLMFPDRSFMVNSNDLGLIYPFSMPWLLLAARHYQDPVLRGFWMEFQGPEHSWRPYGDPYPVYNQRFNAGLPPVDMTLALVLTLLHWEADLPVVPLDKAGLATAVYSPGTETANFRSSWKPEAVYVNVLGSGRDHTCHGHAHADCGHFSLFAGGEYLAIDTGRYNSNEDQHSVVLVDGGNHLEVPEGSWGQNLRSGRLSRFQRHAFVDYILADSAHMKNCMWADRHLLFVRTGDDQAYLVTLDNVNVDNGKHAFWWQLQAHPDCALRITGERSAVVEGKNACLDVFFAIPAPEDFPSDPHRLDIRTDIKEWVWPYGRRQDTALFEKNGLLISSWRRPRLIAEETGLNGVIAAVLAPRRKSQPAFRVRQIAESRIIRIEIRGETFTDTLLCAPDHGYIDLPEYKGFTELAWVRRDPRGRTLGFWTANGAGLKLIPCDRAGGSISW